MKHKLKIKIVCVFLLMLHFVNAQYKTDLKINEILAINKSNFVNDYEWGKNYIENSLIKTKWINKKCLKKKNKFNPVNKSSCILPTYYRSITPFIEKKIENLRKDDEKGICLTLTSVSVVFFILIILCLMFKLIGKISILFSTHRTMKASGITKEELKRIDLPTGEIFAAIALAIYEATEVHDEENTIITIKNTARNYSPWNSKIYTLRETPRKK